MTNIKQICAQLIELWDADCDIDTEINELRTALAKPAPEGPTREQAVAVYSEVMAAHECQTLGEMAEHFAHSVLARWGK